VWKLTAFIGLGLETARFLQGPNSMMMMMMMIMMTKTTRTTTMNTCVSTAKSRPIVEQLLPFVGWVLRVPSKWQESPKHGTKHQHDHNATVLQNFASSTLTLATLPAKSYVSERGTKTKHSNVTVY
jgi:hypothetical protein